MLTAPSTATPHSGYHWPGSLLLTRERRFFEGWYYRVSLPEVGESFAFMYAIEDPAGTSPASGGFAQVLGPGDERTYQLFEQVDGFWAEREQLALGHWQQGPAQAVSAEAFEQRGIRGYQATATLNQGHIEDASGQVTRWCYQIAPRTGWGSAGRQAATMGWLSYLPVFEPGWQILMLDGRASGWIEWKGRRYDFAGVPAYGEKNWGGAFPQKWFWVQANAFGEDLAMVAGGGRRGVLWWSESVAMVGLAAGGRFWRFMPGECEIAIEVAPWGSWYCEALSDRYRAIVTGECRPAEGIELLAPTATGSHFVCRDTLKGQVNVRLERRWGDRRTLINAQTQLGGLETGGGPWDGLWQFRC